VILRCFWLRLRCCWLRLRLFFDSSSSDLVQMGIYEWHVELRANAIDFPQVCSLNYQRLARVIVLQQLKFTKQIF
jgi:hypothetical protein